MSEMASDARHGPWPTQPLQRQPGPYAVTIPFLLGIAVVRGIRRTPRSAAKLHGLPQLRPLHLVVLRCVRSLLKPFQAKRPRVLLERPSVLQRCRAGASAEGIEQGRARDMTRAYRPNRPLS